MDVLQGVFLGSWVTCAARSGGGGRNGTRGLVAYESDARPGMLTEIADYLFARLP
ncbi:hypothetical protein ABGB07_42425 [Micromonosporaceae bacterium B7E4]